VHGFGQVEFIEDVDEKCHARHASGKTSVKSGFRLHRKSGKQRMCVQGSIPRLYRQKKARAGA